MAVGAPRHYRLFVGLSGWLETQTGGSSDAGGFTFALEGRNPFDKSTGVSLSLPRSTSTSLMVCDLGGRVVRQLVAGELPSGRYVIPWDGRDETGARAATGVYFFRLAAGDRRSAVRCVMVR